MQRSINRPHCLEQILPKFLNSDILTLQNIAIITTVIFWNKFLIQNEQRFRLNEAQDILQWIERVNQRPMDIPPSDCTSTDDIADNLRDGAQLCL